MMRQLRMLGVLVSVLAWALAPCAPAGATDYTTANFDNSRDAWNSNETFLSPANVGSIQPVFSSGLGGDDVDAQPLYLSNENTTVGTTNVVYVATEENHIYALSPRLGGQNVWGSVPQYGPPVSTYNWGCKNTWPSLGITSTPVIDTSTDTLYFVTENQEGSSIRWHLRAVSAGTGVEKFGSPSPSILADSDGMKYKQRPALTLANGMIYIAFGSNCDGNASTTFGKIFAYNASNLQLQYAYTPTEHFTDGSCSSFYLGTVWASSGPAADANGNLYFTTGNGCIDLSVAFPKGLGMSLVRMSPQLTLPSGNINSDTWQPCTAQSLSSKDLDYGSGGVALHTDSYSGWNLIESGGKDGNTYFHNYGGNLGGYSYNPCLHLPGVLSHQVTNNGLWGSPALFSGPDGYTWTAIAGNNGALGVWRLLCCNGNGDLQQVTSGGSYPNGGTSPFVTSNGTASGSYLVWAVQRTTYGTLPLQVWNPETGQLLYSNALGNWRNSYGYAILAPAVVDGYAIFASYGTLFVMTAPGHPAGIRSTRRAPASKAGSHA
jgi:hypothetical protein